MPQFSPQHGDSRAVPDLSTPSPAVRRPLVLSRLSQLDLQLLFMVKIYSNDPKFTDILVLANSADPDQTAPRGAV